MSRTVFINNKYIDEKDAKISILIEDCYFQIQFMKLQLL